MKYSIIHIFLFLLFGCESAEKNISYDDKLVLFEKVEIQVDTLFFVKSRPLPDYLNLRELNHWKKEMNNSKLATDDKADHFLYGKKIINNQLLLVSSVEYERNDDIQFNYYEEILGYAYIGSFEKINYRLKIYENAIFNKRKIESLIFENFIIVVESINESFDVSVEGKKAEIDHSFVIFQITENGMKALPEKEAIKILKKVQNQKENYFHRIFS